MSSPFLRPQCLVQTGHRVDPNECLKKRTSEVQSALTRVESRDLGFYLVLLLTD